MDTGLGDDDLRRSAGLRPLQMTGTLHRGVQLGFDVALGQYAVNSIVGPQEKCSRVGPELLLLSQHSRMAEHDLARLLRDFCVRRSNVRLLRTGDVKRDVRQKA